MKTGSFAPVFRVDFYDDIELYPGELVEGYEGVVEIVPEGRKGIVKSC